MKSRTELARFQEKFKVAASGCWEWQGNRTPKGYGMFYSAAAKTKVRAHRFSFEFFKSPIPAGLFVCHSCDNPKCVNPGHLWLGSAADNMADAVVKGRISCADRPGGNPQALSEHQIGEANPRAVLGEADVLAIRDSLKQGATSRNLAVKFGVHYRTIRAVAIRRSWAHI